MTVRPLVLCLDDEPAVLDGLRRSLRSWFDIVTMTEPQEALDALAQNEFTVFVSDLRMPQMDGVAVLERAKGIAPLTTRVLLTGDRDIQGALAAVNQGYVFRIMLKPCPATDLRSTIDAGVAQHQLLRAERELLEATLKGCVDALMDTLGMAQPALFSRAGRLRRLVGALCAKLGRSDGWQVEIAAQIGEIGAMSLSPLAMAMMERGTSDAAAETAMLRKLQKRADDVLARIPRLEIVREIVRFQEATNCTPALPLSADAPEGARVLQAGREYDALVWRGTAPGAAVRALGLRGTHSREILLALSELAAEAESAALAEPVIEREIALHH